MKTTVNTNMNLMIDQKQAEKIFNCLTETEEQITDGWNMPKTTVRCGKDIRCERIETPYQSGPTYMCYLINIGIDDSGSLKKVS